MVNNFIHRIGYHCESSSMRDLFEFYGFPMSEAMVFGLDATMGFGFFDTTGNVSFIPKSDVPFFLGGKQGTIEPNSLACRLLGITLRKQSFTSADKAWEESKRFIDQDTPIILRIDICYLPFYEFDDDVHFGGHAITLAGYDEEKGVALVGDTEYEGFQEVSIDRLKQGRSSTYGPKFMQPNNAHFSMTRRTDGKHPPFAAGVKLAIQQVVNNMLRPSMNNIGIQGLKLFARAIPEWKEKLKGKARLMFDFIHGYIETWGTGGGAFRKLYWQFLKEIRDDPKIWEGPKAWKNEESEILEDCIQLLEGDVGDWTLIAETLKEAADEYKDECLNQVDLSEIQGITLKIVEQEEELFKKLSKIKI